MNMKNKLLTWRTLERICSFLRLLSMLLIPMILVYGLISNLLKVKSAFFNSPFFIIGGLIIFSLVFFSKYPLEAWRKRVTFLIDNFEDTAKFAKNKKRYGEFDEYGNLNIGLFLKRGSEDAFNELNGLIGLDSVKEEMRRLQKVFEFEQSTGKKGNNVSRHYAFLGNPGTGKTTCARILSGLLYQYGRIKYNMYLECTGNDLMGEAQGQTKDKINAIFERCRGGVLFIDEAYVLQQAQNTMALEAIAQLLVHMESEKDTVIIFAGYSIPMKKFIALNPGLESRISTTIVFPDYSAKELVEITRVFLNNKGLKFASDAEGALLKVFEEKRRLNPKNFSNGRYARNCFDEIYQNHAVNCADKTAAGINYNPDLITVEDVWDIRDVLLALN